MLAARNMLLSKAKVHNNNGMKTARGGRMRLNFFALLLCADKAVADAQAQDREHRQTRE